MNEMSDVTASYETTLDFIAFFLIFSYIIDDHSYLKYCIPTKFSQIVHLVSQYTYFDMWKICGKGAPIGVLGPI